MKLNDTEKLKALRNQQKLYHSFVPLSFWMGGRILPCTIKLSRPSSLAHCSRNKQVSSSSTSGLRNLALCLHVPRSKDDVCIPVTSHKGPAARHTTIKVQFQHSYGTRMPGTYVDDLSFGPPPSPTTPYKL